MGEMRRATARDEWERNRERFTATVVIAAAIILIESEKGIGFYLAPTPPQTEERGDLP